MRPFILPSVRPLSCYFLYFLFLYYYDLLHNKIDAKDKVSSKKFIAILRSRLINLNPDNPLTKWRLRIKLAKLRGKVTRLIHSKQ